jgi:hypothetical protein
MSTNFQDVDPTGKRYREVNQLFEAGHLHKASRVIRDAMDDSLKAGIVDPFLIRSADALAERYVREGEYSAAASMYRAVHEVQLNVLGKDHPAVREVRRKLAQAIWQTGGITPKLLDSDILG